MILARLAGGMLLLCGLAVASLMIFGVGRQLACDCFAGKNMVAIALLAFPAAFITLMGYRLAFARPNRWESLLAPWAWLLLALIFLTVGCLLVAKATPGAVEWFLAGILPALLALACLTAMRNAARGRELTPEFLAKAFGKEAAPATDFQLGIEIKNDDKTPMEFVVAMLERHLHMTRTEAVRAMLKIHTQGAILLPLASREESERVAQAIASEAHAQGHPLFCRAVNNDPKDAGRVFS